MKIALYLFFIIYSFLFEFISIFDFIDKKNEKLIISISSSFDNLHNTNLVIESILSQNCDRSF